MDTLSNKTETNEQGVDAVTHTLRTHVKQRSAAVRFPTNDTAIGG